MIVSFRLARSGKDLVKAAADAQGCGEDFVQAADRLRHSISTLEQSLVRFDTALAFSGAAAKTASQRYGALARSVAP